MAELSFLQLLSGAGQRMSNDLKQQLITHPGELGTDREEILRSFLRFYLPKRFEVSTGFVFDSSGKQSHQLDIIISDSHICPRFETVGGTRIFPCESVVAVGQVKSSLTSVPKLRDALVNLESVKMLDRSTNGETIDSTYHEPIDHYNNYLHQIFTFLFIAGKALTADNVRYELLDYTGRHEPYLWPNVIIALDRYLITYCCEYGVCPNPMHARGIAAQNASKNQNVLFKFYLLLGQAIEVTRVSRFPYREYLRNSGKWDADVWHATTDEDEPLPPLLSSL